jgi:hypothetical protein
VFGLGGNILNTPGTLVVCLQTAQAHNYMDDKVGFPEEQGKDEGKPVHPDMIALQQILDFILSKYIPADSFKDADIYLTTNQVFNQIIALYPSSMLNEQHIYLALKGNNFKFDNIDGDLKFVWLFKNKILLSNK